jgi:hypothetical protein
VFGIMVTLQLILICTIQISHFNSISYLIVVCLSMQCEGALASILPTTVLSVFGLRRGHMVYSIMYSVFGVAALTGGLLVKVFQDTIGYEGMFTISFILTSISATLCYKFGDMKYDFVKGMGEENMKKYY